MLIMINGDNKMKMKRDNVRIIRIILGSHGVIFDSRKIVLFEYENNFQRFESNEVSVETCFVNLKVLSFSLNF